LQHIEVYVLSLAKAGPRRASIRAHLDRLGVEYKIVDAVDGAAIPPDEQAKLIAPGANLQPSEIGCYLSHAAAWEFLLESPREAALILEDDARLAPSTVPILRRGVDYRAFDYLFLDVDNRNHDGLVAYDRDNRIDLGDHYTAYALSGGGEGAHAYIITKTEARRRLKVALPIRRPVDVYDTLPYDIRFFALVGKRGAFLSADSLVSTITARNHALHNIRFKNLRRWKSFYAVREFLAAWRPGPRRQIAEMVKNEKLPSGRRWLPLPGGRPVLFE